MSAFTAEQAEAKAAARHEKSFNRRPVSDASSSGSSSSGGVPPAAWAQSLLRPVGDQPASSTRSPPLGRPVAAGLMAVGPKAAGPVTAGPVTAGPVATGPVVAGPVEIGMQQLAQAVAKMGVAKTLEAAAAEVLQPSASSASTMAPAPLASGKAIEGWPQVPCHSCAKLTNWRNCRQERIFIDILDEDEIDHDTRYETWYWCVGCVAVERGVSEAAALGWIRANRQDLTRKMERTEGWKRAKANPPATLEFANASRAGKRMLLRNSILELFRPAAKAILLKAAQLAKRVDCGEEHARLCEEVKTMTDLTQIEAHVVKIDAAEDAFTELCLPLGFADRAKTREELFRWQMSADYADGWFEIRSASGQLLGGFSAFYICRAGHASDPCNTLILSKIWTRNHEDINSCKQGWKCRCCGAGYKVKFGMVVEIRLLGGGVCLNLAPCLDSDDKDAHTLVLQEQFPDVKTPEELYELLPVVLPQEGTYLRKAVPADFWGGGPATDFGVYKLLKMQDLEKLKPWSWKDTLNFFSAQDLLSLRLKVVEGGELGEC